MIRRRVCVARGERLLPASDAWQWQSGDSWVPCPEDREDLALADASRPVGVHPAYWYGRPIGVSMRKRWLITEADGKEHEVWALSASGAVHSLGLDMREVRAVNRMEDWY